MKLLEAKGRGLVSDKNTAACHISVAHFFSVSSFIGYRTINSLMPMSPFKYMCSVHSAKGIWVTWSKVLGWQCLGGAGGTGTTLETSKSKSCCSPL